MPNELKELWSQVAKWPPDLQQKIVDTILAIRAEYIDGHADDLNP